MPDEKDVPGASAPPPNTTGGEPTSSPHSSPFGVPSRPLPTPTPNRKTGQHPRITIEGEDGARFLSEWSAQRFDTTRILNTLNDSVIPWVKKIDTDQGNDRAMNAREFEVIANNIVDLRAVQVQHAAQIQEVAARPIAPIAKRKPPLVRRAAFVVGVVLISIGSASGLALAARAFIER